MKSTILALAAFAAQQVSSHATFQQLWVDGVDQGSKCARLPPSNSPIENVSSTNLRCNANTRPASAKCSVPAGSTVQVEMHQQNGDRSCANEAIGGKHYGPVIVYLSKVGDAASADGSTPFFKIYQNGWAKAPGSAVGDNDYWGVKDMEKCCGKVPVKIPSDIAPGDYLLRAEVIALHAASSGGGAQLYMTCYQITVTGGGSATPSGVLFPGAYKASDPGIGVSIHGSMSQYIVPGPAVVSGGTTQTPGSGLCTVGSSPPSGSPPPTTQPPPPPTTQPPPPTTQPPPPTTQPPPPPTTQPPPSGCASMYGQCGGSGYSGPTCCSSGTCKVSNQWYSQCL